MVEQVPENLESTGPQLILIVDDELRMRRFIRMNMELEGYQVIEAENGLHALDQIRQFTPDLAVMDVMMPEMDGFETLKLLREISTVPVILLTVRDDEEDITRGLALGADDYIYKYHPVYGSPVLNTRENAVRGAKASADGLKVRVVVDDLRDGTGGNRPLKVIDSKLDDHQRYGQRPPEKLPHSGHPSELHSGRYRDPRRQ